MIDEYEQSLIIRDLIKSKIKKVIVVPGDSKVPFTLDVTYEIETKKVKADVRFLRVDITNIFPNNTLPTVVSKTDEYEHEMNIQYKGRKDKYILSRDGKTVFPICFDYIEDTDIIVDIKEEKPKREMTIQEIENILGYKIKILNEKSNGGNNA